MKAIRSRMSFGLGVAAAAVLMAGCSGSSTPSQSPAPVSSSSAAQPSTGIGQGAELIVLAEGTDGIAGLWALDGNSVWKQVGVTPGATALGAAGDGIALATGHSVEIRPGSALGSAGTTRTLKWTGSVPVAPIVALDTSAAGKTVLVTADAQTLTYSVAEADGTTTSLSPAPTQSFTPSAAWLDESRLLVLATGNDQMSRLAVADTGAKTLNSSQSLSGVRVMGLSGDHQIVCLATEAAVFTGPVNSFLGSQSPAASLTLAAGQVVWGLALDTNGSHLYMLSGAMASDGSVASIRELGYAKQGSAWVQSVTVPVPFGRAIGQVVVGLQQS